jgi:hypothetical protein
VQALGDELLAGAGLAAHQHVHPGGGHVADQLAHPRHLRRAADELALDAVALGQAAAQVEHLEGQGALVEGAAHHVHQQVGGEGFLDEVVGAAAHGLDGQGHVAVAGDDDHRQVGVHRLAAAQHLHAVGPGQAHVGDDDAGKAGLQAGQALFGRADALDRQVGQHHGLLAAEAHVGVVFDDEYAEFLAHGCSLGAAGRCRLKHAPPSGRLSARRSPPNSRTMSREMARPRPSPRRAAWW